MRPINATSFDGKSGGAQWRDLRFSGPFLGMFFNSVFSTELDIVLGAQTVDQQGHDKQDCQHGGEHASDDNSGQRLLRLGANAIGQGSGTEAQAGGHAGHHYGSHFVAATLL
jgi:hypothetical protein